MKRLKRSIAVILSLAIVMTGIYWSENPAEEVQAATETEVNSEMLELKFQRGITDETINKIRVVASVDSPNYSAVGFAIDKGDGNGEQRYTIDTKQYPLPQRIKSSVEGLDYSFSPKVVDTSSEYFLTAKWNAIEGTKYTVRAWVKTFEGKMVYGQSRCIELADLSSSTTHLNMSFELNAGCTLPMSTENPDKYADIPVTYNGTTKTAKVISVKENTVHVNVKDVNRANLPSVSEFVFGEYGSSVFRNLYTTYDGTGDADTTWYDANETEYVIATSADLYGLASINESFAGKTIYVVSDIEVNKGQSTTSGWITTKDAEGKAITDGTDFPWTPIGKTTPFAGTFEGNMHTISGIYAKQTTNVLGFFAETTQGSNIQNLRLENSYFHNAAYGEGYTLRGTGSIVGSLAGNLENVYSNAYVAGTNYTGGLVGSIIAKKDYTLYITKCWFDGNVYRIKGYQHGGIIGSVLSGTINMSNCLNTGNIDCNSGTLKGGLCGRVRTDADSIDSIDITMWNCLNFGKLKNFASKTTSKDLMTGSGVGDISRNNKYEHTVSGKVSSVYATSDSNKDIPYQQYDGVGYDPLKLCENKIEIVDNIAYTDWKFDTSIWGIKDGKPILNMTPVVSQ